MLDNSHRPIWRPYTQEKTQPNPLLIERASGSYLYSKSGKKFFDGISSWWLITHGHCQPEIMAAIQKQSQLLDQIVFTNFSHEPGEELAQEILAIAPKELTRVFFSDNGSTAVEVALKMTLQACAQKGQAQKTKILAFDGAYHGDTVGAMSVSERGAFNSPYSTILFDVLRTPHPGKLNINEFINNFEQALQTQHLQIAAVILEPLIQGAGGMIVWPDEAVQKVVALCKQYGVFVVFDEVMTGFGRTGQMFAMDRLGVVPDLVCLSKGLTGGALPLALTLASEEIYQAFLDTKKSKMFFHGHSFTGNPISCAAAVANLKLWKQKDSLQKLANIERAHYQSLETIRQKLPLIDARICGTMAAIELEITDTHYHSEFSGPFMAEALKRNLFLRPLGNVIYLLPPYCSTPEEIYWAWNEISEVTSKLLKL